MITKARSTAGTPRSLGSGDEDTAPDHATRGKIKQGLFGIVKCVALVMAGDGTSIE
jgi:hypothetical protein